MKVPEWATDEARSEVKNKMEEMELIGFKVRTKTLIDNYSTFFAEYERRNDDLILHFFPRAGNKDQWSVGQYLPKCRSCGADRPKIQNSRTTPCEKCGHVGLVYVPGRAEMKASVSFPSDIQDILKKAVDVIWAGEVAIDKVDELGAVAIQLQGAASIPDVELSSMLEKLCDKIDAGIEETL